VGLHDLDGLGVEGEREVPIVPRALLGDAAGHAGRSLDEHHRAGAEVEMPPTGEQPSASAGAGHGGHAEVGDDPIRRSRHDETAADPVGDEGLEPTTSAV
jgi:hypothetical protein